LRTRIQRVGANLVRDELPDRTRLAFETAEKYAAGIYRDQDWDSDDITEMD
jgi:hypothetical protein